MSARKTIVLENEIKVVMKTGELVLGSRETVKAVAHGRGKLVIVARNCPLNLRDLILHYAKLSNIPVYMCTLTSRELGDACGRRFMVSAVTIFNEGESEILKLVEKEVAPYAPDKALQ